MSVDVTEIIVINDTQSISPQTSIMIPRSFNNATVTSNTASKRKCRPRNRPRLPLKPATPQSYVSKTVDKRNHNRKVSQSSRTRKRKRKREPERDSNQRSILESFKKPLFAGISPTSNRITPRRSTRIQNKQKRRKLNADPPPLIDLSNEHNDDDSNSNSSTSNHKMSVDGDHSDFELMEKDDDIDMKDITINTNNTNNTNTTKHNTSSVIDLDEDDDIDIDLNDTELPLFGIAIGKHQDFWNCKQEERRPQIMMNKHTNTIAIKLKSVWTDHYVSVSIKTSNIASLYIPEHPALFDLYDLNVDSEDILEVEGNGMEVVSYLQVVFMQTKQQLSAYQWLSEYYDPQNMEQPGIERITMIMGWDSYKTFKELVMNKTSFCELRTVVSNVDDNEKTLWLDNLLYKRGIQRAWKRFDKIRTTKYLRHLLLPDDSGMKTDEQEEEEHEEEKREEIDITANDNQTEDILINIDDSGDYSEYIPNDEILLIPHHSNSMIYAKTRKSAPAKTLECYWVFPAQHEHRLSIMHIESKDYLLVSTEDEYLNDTIIDFQLKYTYASWPGSFKDKVYIFTSFFWRKLVKIRSKNVSDADIKQLFRWTKHIKSLFDKEYIIIPKCDHNHWELIIVAYAGKVVNKYSNKNEENGEDNALKTPCIAVLDSLGGRTKSQEFILIRKWLNLEAKNHINRNNKRDINGNSNHKEKEDVNGNDIFTTKSISGYIVKVPKQPNGHDCGCFLLRNVLQFGIDRGFKDTSNKKNFNMTEWYDPEEDGVGYRKEISSTLARLTKEQKGINEKLRSQHEQHQKQLIREQIQMRKEKEKQKEKEKTMQKVKANNFNGYESA